MRTTTLIILTAILGILGCSNSTEKKSYPTKNKEPEELEELTGILEKRVEPGQKDYIYLRGMDEKEISGAGKDPIRFSKEFSFSGELRTKAEGLIGKKVLLKCRYSPVISMSGVQGNLKEGMDMSNSKVDKVTSIYEVREIHIQE